MKKDINFLTELKILLNTESDKKYLSVLLPILLCETREEAIRLLCKYSLSENIFHYYLTSFKNNFPEQEQYIQYLETLYKDYSKMNVKKEEVLPISGNKEIYQRILESNECVEEYCFVNGGSIHKIKNIIRGYRSDESEEILKRDNSSYISKMKDIIYQIINEQIDYLDYYTQTKIGLDDLLALSKNLSLEKEQYIQINQFVKKGKKIESENRIVESAQLEKLTKFGDREITIEEKERIFDYLRLNKISFCYYNIALVKYVKGYLKFGKQLEKQGNF